MGDLGAATRALSKIPSQRIYVAKEEDFSNAELIEYIETSWYHFLPAPQSHVGSGAKPTHGSRFNLLVPAICYL